jgi:hypothetical protein
MKVDGEGIARLPARQDLREGFEIGRVLWVALADLSGEGGACFFGHSFDGFCQNGNSPFAADLSGQSLQYAFREFRFDPASFKKAVGRHVSSPFTKQRADS